MTITYETRIIKVVKEKLTDTVIKTKLKLKLSFKIGENRFDECIHEVNYG